MNNSGLVLTRYAGLQQPPFLMTADYIDNVKQLYKFCVYLITAILFFQSSLMKTAFSLHTFDFCYSAYQEWSLQGDCYL